MLTPVTPNPIATSTTIKSHGSEARSAPNHIVAEAIAAQHLLGASGGIGLETSNLLASVNAEAATAGNPTILQTLALAVATQLGISKRDEESFEDFFLRIAAALESARPEERETIETRAGLKLLNIRLSELAAAFRQPGAALAARLSAMAEAPQAMPQKAAAATATNTYLLDAAGVSRAAETLAMVTQSRARPNGTGIFSSAPAGGNAEKQPVDARSLQNQLRTLFEPGVAETRIEIETPRQVPQVLVLDGADEAEARQSTSQPPSQLTPADADPASETGAAAVAIVATEDGQTDSAAASDPAADIGSDEPPAESLAGPDGAPAARNGETRSAGGLPAAQNNNVPTAAQQLKAIAREMIRERLDGEMLAAARREVADSRQQTLLTLKGLAEAVTLPIDGTAERMGPPEQAKDVRPYRAPSPNGVDAGSAEAAARAGGPAVEQPAATPRHIAAQPVPFRMLQTAEAEASERKPGAGSSAAAAQTQAEPGDAAAPAQSKPVLPDAIPFGFAATTPVREEFRAEAKKEGRRDEDGDEGPGEEEEDAEARRERLARKATDDLLEPQPDPEPALKITRDSSQADRAYALYQRMGGF